jgi:hypothetical protein
VRHPDRWRSGSRRRAICYGRAIQLERCIRGPAGPTGALVLAALAAASASAAASNSVSISGPRSVQAGDRVKLHFSGYADAAVHGLRVWLDDRSCAATASAEGARPELRPPTNFAVRGNFRAVLTIGKSSTGTHIVCAYLVYQGTQNTAARASWRYVTH